VPCPPDDGQQIMALCRQLMRDICNEQGVYQVQVTALDPVDRDSQLELFDSTDEPHGQVTAVMDAVNRPYGELVLDPARLLKRPPTCPTRSRLHGAPSVTSRRSDSCMCGGVYYASNGGDIRFYFPNPEAQRPGGIQLLAWGRRPGKAGKLPLGGWARLNSIDEGRWDRWFPIPVKMPLKCFMEQDIEGHNR
jgi:hypothetical protein